MPAAREGESAGFYRLLPALSFKTAAFRLSFCELKELNCLPKLFISNALRQCVDEFIAPWSKAAAT